MTPAEIRTAISADPAILALVPDFAAIAAALATPELRPLTVEEVFDVLYESSDYLTLKTAQLQNNATALMAFAVLADAKSLGPGAVNLELASTVMLFDQLEAANLLSSAGRAALTAKATSPRQITAAEVEVACKSDTGELIV